MSGLRNRRVTGYRGVTPRGASRARVRREWSPQAKRRAKRWVGLLVLVMLAGGAYYFGSGAVSQWLQRPVASIAVEGEFRFIAKERVTQVLSAQLTADFIQLDLAELKRVLEQEPWIERAALARRWPDALQVRIYEEQPIARWGDTGFLNQRGDIIELGDNSQLADLPRLHGADSEALQVMRRYQDMAPLLRARGMSIAKLESDQKRSWTLALKDGVQIRLGRDQVLEKMHRFVRVYDRYLYEEWDAVLAVDVRYSNGLAVRWKPE